MIFVSDLSAKGPPSFESLSVPHPALLSTKFEQPRFGANYLSLEIRASPGAGLVDGTRAEIRLKDKGMFEFASALEKTRERAIYMKRQSAEDEDGLRKSQFICGGGRLSLITVVCAAAYSTPGPSGASSPYVPADIPSENPPGYDD